jgi:aspartokinase-like uncharacterized kinase
MPAPSPIPPLLPRPTVIKLGGSLHDAPALRAWLRRLAAADGPPRVIVPGGGPFADRVRATQVALHLDDPAAHRMALLAMAQFGVLCAGLVPGLVTVPSVAAVRNALALGQVPIWLPLDLLAGHPEIEESWRVTSDSLALWLAHGLEASRLILVKSAPVPAGPADARRLEASGLIDRAFPELLRQWPVAFRCMHQDDWASFGRPLPVT